MLSGLFKRKDRKSKAQTDDDDPDFLQKEISANRQSPQPKVSSYSDERQAAPLSPSRSQPARQSSKLQKAPPNRVSKQKSSPRQEDAAFATRSQPLAVAPPVAPVGPSVAPQLDEPITSSPLSNPFEEGGAFESNGANKAHQSLAAPAAQPKAQSREQTPEAPGAATTADRAQVDARARNVFSPIKDALRPNAAAAATIEPKPEKLKKARARMA